MAVMIGSARIGENGRITGGAAGDQKQASVPDKKGEVSMQEFYVHSKGWVILRPRSSKQAGLIAKAMERACNNPNLGYDQAGRLGVIKYGTGSAVPTECDCSSLVRQCIIEATGVDPGNFSTASEVSALLYTKLFDRIYYTTPKELKLGDILVTRCKGHTAVVTHADNGLPVLKRGSKGGHVKELQTLLNYASFGAQLTVDGIFGSITEIAVISFQKLHGLKADGIVGPLTWAALQG